MKINKETIDLRLVSLALKNFKGIRSLNIELNKNNATIYGANEAGKTSISDSISWVLFGKDTLDRSPQNFGIKTLVDGVPLADADHSVVAKFGDVELKKIYKENWVTKRGYTKAEFRGNITDHYIDDIPKAEKEYKEFIDDLLDEKKIKMLTILNYFLEILPWKERRDVLIELCGEIDVNEIISSNPDLSGYPSLLDGKREDERREALTKSRKRLRDELENIPARLDELNRLIKEVEDLEGAKANIATFTKSRETIQQKILSIKEGGIAATIKNSISTLNGELIELKNGFSEQTANALSDAKKAVRDAEEKANTEVHAINMKVAEAKSRKQTKIGEYNSFKALIEGLLTTINTAKSDQDKVRASEPKPDTGGGVCPMCEQPIAEDHSYQDYLEEFNANKAKQLKELDEAILNLTAELDTESSKLEQIKSEGKAIEAEIKLLETTLQKAKDLNTGIVEGLKSELQALEAEQPKLEEDEKFIAITAKIEAEKVKLQNLESETSSQVSALTAKIQELDGSIEEYHKVLINSNNNAEYAKRIAELKAERDKVANELEEVEKGIELIEAFVRARSTFISDKVNAMFNGVNWTLFEDQINGGVKEVCEATGKNGVPYSGGMNNAQRVQVGLEVIRVLSDFYGVQLPVFVDNRESVTVIPETDLQVISLVVSPQDKQLRVEIEETVNAFA